MGKEKVLLHICCAPDATHSVNFLRQEGYEVTGFFYNPCIHPTEEYKKRKTEIVRLAAEMNLSLVEDNYAPDHWFDLTQGHETDPECGKRCEICYRMRLEETAKTAAANGFTSFTTTLTISPHKKAELINTLGEEAGKVQDVQFLSLNLKKQDGFKKSLELSKKHNLYRQHYCGCIYSLERSEKREKRSEK